MVKAAGLGYADRIEVLIGFNANTEKITGLFILDQKETPGLGNKIIHRQWRSQFVDKDTGLPLTVVKGKSSAPQEIDAINGATISSKSVVNIINRTVVDVKKQLMEKAAGRRKG